MLYHIIMNILLKPIEKTPKFYKKKRSSPKNFSMIPTTELEARHGIPGCTYSIHKSSIDDIDAGRPAGVRK